MADESKKSFISELQEKFKKQEGNELMHLLYNYLTTHKDMDLFAAKGLVNIISSENPKSSLRKSATSFVEAIFEDKMNNRDFQKSDYYVEKVKRNSSAKDADAISR